MTALGTIAGQVRDPASVTRPQSVVNTNGTSYTHVPDAIYSYGSIAGQIRLGVGETEIVEVIVYAAPPPSNEATGDHITQLYKSADLDSNLGRNTVYMVGSNVRTVIKEIRIVNTAGATRTLTIWMGGLPYVYSLAATGSTGDKVLESCWTVLYPADLVEVLASAAGIGVEFCGVEEVTAE